jgi:hypothetical protein
MQIVVNIPDKTYKYFAQGLRFADDVEMAIVAIVDGTALPKGHGRLGDLDALETEMVSGIRAGNYEEGYETFAHINNMNDCVDCVRYADTIIEKDRSEK